MSFCLKALLIGFVAERCYTRETCLALISTGMIQIQVTYVAQSHKKPQGSFQAVQQTTLNSEKENLEEKNPLTGKNEGETSEQQRKYPPPGRTDML